MENLLDRMGEIPISNENAQKVIVTVLAIAVVTALWGAVKTKQRPSQWRRVLLALILATLLAFASWYTLENTWKPFPDRVPQSIYIAGGLAAFVLISAVIQKGRHLLLLVMTLLAGGSAWGVFNLQFQEYPTLRSLNPTPVAVAMDYQMFEDGVAKREAPRIGDDPVGALVTVDLEGTESQFVHRPAVAYVPPAYFTQPELKLPVIALMAGNPGKPEQWFAAGDADTTLDNYQKEHGGVSPIVVSVDGTGTFTANPICVDGPKDKVQTYLATDVPAQMKEKFRVVDDQQKWTIGGLSYGGTCALQVATNHPEAYGTFLDFSGQPEPTVGDHKRTVDEFFGGDEDAFQDVNPKTLLERAKGTDKYSHLQGAFVVGEKDHYFGPGLKDMHQAAVDAGIKADFKEVEGGHSYQVWRIAFMDTLDFAARRGGLK